MSAVNAFIESHRAVVWTDAAVYDADNVLLSIERKCWPVRGRKMVVAGRGLHFFTKFAAQALERLGLDIDDIEANGEEIIDGIIDGADQIISRAVRQEIELMLIGWSEEDDRPKCAQFSTVPPVGVDRFSMTTSIMAPAIPAHEIERVKMELGGRMPPDMRRIGVPLMEAQRRTPGSAEFGCGGAYLVGGHVLETEIARTGVRQTIVHTWNDKVGEKINPFQEETVVRLSRQQRRAAERAGRQVA